MSSIWKTSTIALPCLVLALAVNAADEQKRQQEIDQQVWAPFTQAYESANAVALNALYADEVLRVTPEGIDTEGHFKKENLQRFSGRKNSNITTELDFWFEHRQTIADTSYEVGFFRIKSSSNNETSTFYGQFHIVLKKINGQWKITQDWDNSFVRGQNISEADFKKKAPLVFQ